MLDLIIDLEPVRRGFAQDGGVDVLDLAQTLFIGIALLVVGLLNKDVSRSVKIVSMSLIIGVLFVVVSLIMLMPGSSEVVGQLLQQS